MKWKELSINTAKAQEFKDWLETGDIIGLKNMEKYFTQAVSHSDEDVRFSHLIVAAIHLNPVIIEMEQGITEWDREIDDSYRTIMCEIHETLNSIIE